MTVAEYNKAYDDAIASESEDRCLAFLCESDRICGLDVKPLTLRLLERLKLARSPFILGGQVNHVQVAQFLWIVSVDFSPDKEKRDAWLSERQGIVVTDAIKEIDEYLDRAFLDSRIFGKKSRPMVSVSASVALEMAGEPWRMKWQEIMDYPLAVLFQLMKAKDIQDGNPARNKRSDKITEDYLAELNKPKPKGKKRGKK